MREFIALSWNLERVNLDKTKDIASEVAGTVSGSVSHYSDIFKAKPFIGFLHEIKGGETDQGRIQDMCNNFGQEFERHYNLKGTKFDYSYCGGSGATREWTIIFYKGLEVTSNSLDVRGAMEPYIESDKVQANNKLDIFKQSKQNRSQRPGKFTDQSKQNSIFEFPDFSSQKTLINKPENYRQGRYESDWYRNGVLCEIKDGEGDAPVRIASLHAPGPGLTNKYPAVIDAIKDAATSGGADIVIGDLNTTAKLADNDYADLTDDWAPNVGSTLGKKTAEKLGTHRWDRILMARDSGLEGMSQGPVLAKKLDNAMRERVSDHAMVVGSFQVNDKKVKDLNAEFTLKPRNDFYSSRVKGSYQGSENHFSFEDDKYISNYDVAESKLSGLFGGGNESQLYNKKGGIMGNSENAFNQIKFYSSFGEGDGNKFDAGDEGIKDEGGMQKPDFVDPDSFFNLGGDQEALFERKSEQKNSFSSAMNFE
jgi:hypothetical protein